MTNKSKGTVTMTLEAYTEILLRLNRLERAIKVQKAWGENIEVELDTALVKDIIMDKLTPMLVGANYDVQEHWYNPSVTLAMLVNEEDAPAE